MKVAVNTTFGNLKAKKEDIIMIYGIGVGVYMAIMIYIGYRMKDKIKTAEDYLVAGRGLGIVLSTATLTSCFLGGAIISADANRGKQSILQCPTSTLNY